MINFFLDVDLCDAVCASTGKEWFGGVAGDTVDGLVKVFAVHRSNLVNESLGVQAPEPQRPIVACENRI